MDEESNFCPAIAVPTTVKMPEPMTAPMPRAVSESGPRVLVSRRSASCESEISLSMDLVAKSWVVARGLLPVCVWPAELAQMEFFCRSEMQKADPKTRLRI